MTTELPNLSYVHHNEEQFGPYSVDEIRQYLAEGRLDNTALVFIDELQEWTAIDEALTYLSRPVQVPAFIEESVNIEEPAIVQESKVETSVTTEAPISAVMQPASPVTTQTIQTGSGTWQVQSMLAGSMEIVIVDEAGKSVAVSESARIRVTPGEIHEFKIEAPQEAIAGQMVEVKVTAFDRFGNQVPVAGRQLHVRMQPFQASADIATRAGFPQSQHQQLGS